MKQDRLLERVLFRGVEGNYIRCDIPLYKAYTTVDNKGKKIRIPASKIEGAKLKLEDNNIQVLEKVKSLPKRRLIWISYTKNVPLGRKIEDITIKKVLTNEEYLKLEEPYKQVENKLHKQNMKELLKVNYKLNAN